MTLPVVFFGHGSPTNVLEDNPATRCWHDLGKRIGRPRAILVVSAHWYTDGTRVTAMPAPRTIHDFGPIAPELFELDYPAPGSPELAARIGELLELGDEAMDQEWGLDHGSWTVLMKAYPGADIPVVQLSIDANKTGGEHLALAQRLSCLRAEGVLIAASGNIVHNLKTMDWDPQSKPYEWAQGFNDLILEKVADRNHSAICHFTDLENAELAIPHTDHFIPLL